MTTTITTNENGEVTDVSYTVTANAYDGDHPSGATYRTLRDITVRRSYYASHGDGDTLDAADVAWWVNHLITYGDYLCIEAESAPAQWDAIAQAAGYEDAADMANALHEVSNDMDALTDIMAKAVRVGIAKRGA